MTRLFSQVPRRLTPKPARSSSSSTFRPARKRFGQHFLHDPEVVRRILDGFAPRRADCVVEIGPGRGALTDRLLECVDCLHAIELDRDLVEFLDARYRPRSNLVVHQADALYFDLSTVCPGDRLRVIGNLPYNVSTPLLFHVLEAADRVVDMCFMLQKEVSERISAGPGTKRYGRLSVMAQYRCRVEHLLDVPPGAFIPPPKVQSSVVRLVPYAVAPWPAVDEAHFDTLVRAAFNHRRKTLRRSLASMVAPRDFETAGIDPRYRPEQLSVAQLVRLSNAALGGSG